MAFKCCNKTVNKINSFLIYFPDTVNIEKRLLFSTCTNPIIHLFYPPKICIGIVLDYSWDMFMSQEKL